MSSSLAGGSGDALAGGVNGLDGCEFDLDFVFDLEDLLNSPSTVLSDARLTNPADEGVDAPERRGDPGPVPGAEK